ncbi:MAG: LCP family protein [Chloroflexi bacterium]|nr:LCP family protein [Chloroflexota bacterium]
MPSKSFHIKRISLVLVCVAIFVCLGFTFWYALWLRPALQTPLAESLKLPTVSFGATTVPWKKPLCGDQPELLVLMVGIDYRGTEYLYGLADVIRVVRVDFTKPQVNIVALPRALLVNIPEDRFDVPGPILLNQSYFFGTPGMGHYKGSAYGAGALADAIQYNFAESVDHYIVVDFQTFVNFIDAIGGIEVDLPTYVDNRPDAFFPAGPQILNGSQALQLARIRKKYSDLSRINNQTIILRAIFRRLREPRVIAKFPEILAVIKNAVVTDATLNQIRDAICLLKLLPEDNLLFFDPPEELLIYDEEYIPTLNQNMQIYRWDKRLIQWIHESLYTSE